METTPRGSRRRSLAGECRKDGRTLRRPGVTAGSTSRDSGRPEYRVVSVGRNARLAGVQQGFRRAASSLAERGTTATGETPPERREVRIVSPAGRWGVPSYP